MSDVGLRVNYMIGVVIRYELLDCEERYRKFY